MTRQQVTAVFDMGLPFEHGLDKVSQNTENTHNNGYSKPLKGLDAKTELCYKIACNEGKDKTTQKTFNRFVGGYPLNEFMLAKILSNEKSKDIIAPDQDKNPYNDRSVKCSVKVKIRYLDQ